jgi:hypothetical protein
MYDINITPGVHLLIGMINSGKTRRIRNTLHQIGPAPTGVIICGCEYGLDMYKQNFPNMVVGNDFGLLEAVADGEIAVVDDFLYAFEWHANPTFRQLALSAKKRRITLIITMSWPQRPPKWLRDTMDDILLYYSAHEVNRKRIFGYYATGVTDISGLEGMLRSRECMDSPIFLNCHTWEFYRVPGLPEVWVTKLNYEYPRYHMRV